MQVALIGNGAIAKYVAHNLEQRGIGIVAHLLRPARCTTQHDQQNKDTIRYISSVDQLAPDVTQAIDCAGHEALRQHGPALLRRGVDLTTVSLGALADQGLYDALHHAACEGRTKLHLASGAIGALDALRAARIGPLHEVRYIGRKPPQGWMCSVAEDRLDLHNMGEEARSHFTGSAREAALQYPKNANVAAAVALAGLGFDATRTELISDPALSGNLHEIHACGAFGDFSFVIQGQSLPGNPRNSALAAMSAVSTILRQTETIVI